MPQSDHETAAATAEGFRDTASDLVRFGCSLKVECTACGAARTMNAVEVHRVHGNANLTHLAPRLKCSRCKRKEAKLAVLGPVYPH